MTVQTPVPSRFARTLLRLTSSADATDAAIGDVFEELEHRTAAGRAPRWPRFWVNLQVVRFASVAVMTSLPRTGRALWYSVGDAVRSLRRQPAHAVVILIVLGTGISAATVTFTVVDAVLFRPLKFDQSDRIVSIRIATSKRPRRPSKAEVQVLPDSTSSIEGVAEYTAGQVSATIDGVTQPVQVAARHSSILSAPRFDDADRSWMDCGRRRRQRPNRCHQRSSVASSIQRRSAVFWVVTSVSAMALVPSLAC